MVLAFTISNKMYLPICLEVDPTNVILIHRIQNKSITDALLCISMVWTSSPAASMHLVGQWSYTPRLAGVESASHITSYACVSTTISYPSCCCFRCGIFFQVVNAVAGCTEDSLTSGALGG